MKRPALLLRRELRARRRDCGAAPDPFGRPLRRLSTAGVFVVSVPRQGCLAASSGHRVGARHRIVPGWDWGYFEMVRQK